MKDPAKKNENYFNERSLQSVYWAGFIASRGTIYPTKPLVQLKVREDKEERLVKFIEHTELTTSINTDRNKPAPDRKHVIRKRIAVTSNKWKEDLNKLYNLPFHRTNTYYPNLTDNLEIQAFLLGYLDAGSFIGYSTNSKTKDSFTLTICGHLSFCNWVKFWIDNWVKESKQRMAACPNIKNKETKTSILTIRGYRALNLYNLLSSLPVDKSDNWNKEYTAYITQKEAA